jgi:hypothetical protein
VASGWAQILQQGSASQGNSDQQSSQRPCAAARSPQSRQLAAKISPGVRSHLLSTAFPKFDKWLGICDDNKVKYLILLNIIKKYKIC